MSLIHWSFQAQLSQKGKYLLQAVTSSTHISENIRIQHEPGNQGCQGHSCLEVVKEVTKLCNC